MKFFFYPIGFVVYSDLRKDNPSNVCQMSNVNMVDIIFGSSNESFKSGYNRESHLNYRPNIFISAILKRS